MDKMNIKEVFFLIWIFTQFIMPIPSFGQTIYVSPVGNDNNNGSQENPVQTFQKGADLAKSQRASVVEFAGGEYLFTSTVILDATYSGITFQSASGSTPVFTSLKQVTGWTVYNGNIMVANLPSGITNIKYLHDVSETWLKRSSTSFFRPDFVAPCGGAECEHWEPGAPQLRKTFTLYPTTFSIPNPLKASQYDLRAHMTVWHA
jgi:hypothetical protein